MEEATFKTGSQLPVRFARKEADVTKIITASSQLQVHPNVDREQRETSPER